MFDQISTLGWVLIIGLAVFILALNLGLFLGVKQKMQKDNWIDKMTSASKVLRDPSKKDNDKLQQLSDEVKNLKQNTIGAINNGKENNE